MPRWCIQLSKRFSKSFARERKASGFYSYAARCGSYGYGEMENGELGWQAWNSHFRLVPEVGRIAYLRQLRIDIPGSLPAAHWQRYTYNRNNNWLAFAYTAARPCTGGRHLSVTSENRKHALLCQLLILAISFFFENSASARNDRGLFTALPFHIFSVSRIVPPNGRGWRNFDRILIKPFQWSRLL